MGKITAHFDLDCGCCPGGGPYLVVGDCQSLTGTATLCGFSGYSADEAPYDPMAPTDWEGQYRKWRLMSVDMDHGWADVVKEHESEGCAGEVTFTENRFFTLIGEFSSSITCDGCVVTGELTQDVWSSTPSTFTPPCGSTVFGLLNAVGVDFSVITAPAQAGYYATTIVTGTYERTLTTATAAINGTDSGCEGIVSDDLTVTSTNTATLSDERYLYDALADLQAIFPEDVESGDSCCAVTTAADLTSPESTSPISITGTAVRVPITVFGCGTAGTQIDVYVTVSQGGSEYVIPIILLCMVPGFFYVPLPSPGDDPICFESASLEP